MKNIKLILEKDDKIQDKKIFILPNIEGKNTTYWHFRNYDVIFPNWLGFDIHNYIDNYIEYSLCSIYGSRQILINELYYPFDVSDMFSEDARWKIMIMPENSINGTMKLDNDATIYYFVHINKVKGIRIRKDLFNFDFVRMEVKDYFDEITIDYIDNNKLMSLSFIRSKIDGIIDIEDYDKCVELLSADYRNTYTNLVLGRI